jgi:flagellar protein FliS
MNRDERIGAQAAANAADAAPNRPGSTAMSPAARAAYRSAEVETLSQRDLILKLYQGMERFLIQAQLAMQNREPATAHDNCQRAKAILIELMSTLNIDAGGEVAQQLHALYSFFITQVVEANLRKDPAKIAAVLPIISSLREAWQQIPDELANSGSLPPSNDGHLLSLRV